ncbi:MAG: DUF6088 family protein [Clostridiaceae bacterium]|nr:DUF6088 family protein [Clostridiaceae bacterium]
MEKTGYRDILLHYIKEQEPEQPILTEQIAKYVAQQTGQEETAVKKAVNVNMARLEKAGHVIRVAKGIYCRKIPTAFGYYTPNMEALFCRQLLYNEDRVIGYETGLSALNRLGLVSQMPKRRYIATNLYTKKVPAGIQIEIRKPPAIVNETNYRYLQLLDSIRDIDEAPVDAVKPAEVIKGTARELGLNTGMLILMARKHYNQKTLLRTIDMLLEGQYEAAPR